MARGFGRAITGMFSCNLHILPLNEEKQCLLAQLLHSTSFSVYLLVLSDFESIWTAFKTVENFQKSKMAAV